MNKQILLFLSPLPPPYYGSAMSSQTCLRVLQSSSKYEVTNIKVNYSESFSDIEKLTLKKITGYFMTLFRIIYYSIKIKPHLVYIMPATSGFAFIRDFSYSFILKLLNHNMLYHLRTQITEKEKKNRLKNYVFHKAFKNSKVITLGKELKSNILTYVDPSDIYILPNTIRGSLTETELEELEANRMATKKLRMIFISNMMKTKGWYKTLLSARLLQQKNIDFSLQLAGSWPSEKEKNDFFNLIEKYNLQKNVTYLGHIDKKQKKEVLSESDVMVFPTEYRYEALPRVIIEAYEYGLPVISTKAGSIPSMIIHEQTGYLLEEVTPEEITGYLVRLTDKKKLVQMGQKARERYLSQYELSVFSKNFQSIIDDVMMNLANESGKVKMNKLEDA